MLAYILSQPRSGSTVLSAMLDRRKGVVVMPESNFPQVLGHITSAEREDRHWLAALYRGSTLPPRPIPPTPLSISDAMACMEGTDADILFSLGKALAAKLGRNPAEVTHVVWKTVRMIGMHEGPLAAGGKFVILRRNLHNVFDSQFRVDFGIRNRNPWRYAIFTQSYEHAFSKVPKARKFEIDYAKIPERLSDLVDFLEIPDRGEWESGVSSIEIVARTASWLTQATGEFRDTDAEKRSKLDPRVVRSLDLALAVTRLIRPIIGPVRRYYDRCSFEVAREDAQWLLDQGETGEGGG